MPDLGLEEVEWALGLLMGFRKIQVFRVIRVPGCIPELPEINSGF